jgi:UDP-3-O-[3-hydroxymyristoyl] glucosamine N-acyltransferase
VILGPGDREHCPVPVLIGDNPYLAYAKAGWLLHPAPDTPAGRHPQCRGGGYGSGGLQRLDWPRYAVVEEGTEIGPRAFIGPGSVVGAHCRIGEETRLVARVTLCAGVRVGRRALLQPGCVIGRDGFGFARDGRRWFRMPQLGGVDIGDDVEIGANSCVDRGALTDTIIEAGAKLDNLIQIGHNCRIGENTAMAACSGISGSTHIGRDCTIAGAVGMAGHLEIGDNVHFTGMAMVTRSFPEPGVYSSGIPGHVERGLATQRRALPSSRRSDAARQAPRGRAGKIDPGSGTGLGIAGPPPRLFPCQPSFTQGRPP